MTVEPVRVLRADDHPAFRGAVRVLVDSTPGLEIAGEAATGIAAVEHVRNVPPDVVAMDIHTPGLNGIVATREILTTHANADSVFAALAPGARGYLLKDSPPGDIGRAIQAVGRGEAILRARDREAAHLLLRRVPSALPVPEHLAWSFGI